MEKLISLALRFGLLKKPLELAVKGWRGAQGYRTQASLAIAGAIAGAAALGWITWDVARPLIETLVGVAGATALDKLHRALPLVEQAATSVAEEAAKDDK